MEEKTTFKKYAWTRILLMIIPYFFIVGLFSLSTYSILGLDIADPDLKTSSWQDVTIYFSNMVGTFLTIWLGRKYIDKETFSSLGLSKVIKRDITFGLIMGFLMLFVGFIGLLLFDQTQYIGCQFIFSDFVAGFLLYVFVALTEELLMRGYVLSNLMDSMNKYLALVISSLIFSIMHGGNPSFGWFPALELFLAGILFGLPYLYTRNLWFPIALHFSWNFFQGTVLGFKVSGQEHYSVIQQTYESENLWNGGSFGFEGSILSVLFSLIGIVIVYKVYYRPCKVEINLVEDPH